MILEPKHKNFAGPSEIKETVKKIFNIRRHMSTPRGFEDCATKRRITKRRITKRQKNKTSNYKTPITKRRKLQKVELQNVESYKRWKN
jgi:hypothetical protein